ncbi:MAG: archease [Candidatus Omnitrophica bacterium]|nr:archease [Candidatus Omnitrophota bacterium]
MKSYEIIEHTADIGIRVKGKDLRELFRNAALAMFDLIATRLKESKSPDKEKILVKIKSDNLEELFVNWLNELLSLSSVKEKIFCEVSFKNLDKNSLEAEVVGCALMNYKIESEIKAATYHQLQLREEQSGWQAEVIFDV